VLLKEGPHHRPHLKFVVIMGEPQPPAPDYREHDGLPHALPAVDPYHRIEENDPEIKRH